MAQVKYPYRDAYATGWIPSRAWAAHEAQWFHVLGQAWAIRNLTSTRIRWQLNACKTWVLRLIYFEQFAQQPAVAQKGCHVNFHVPSGMFIHFRTHHPRSKGVCLQRVGAGHVGLVSFRSGRQELWRQMGREDESSFIDAIRKLYVYIEEIEHIQS